MPRTESSNRRAISTVAAPAFVDWPAQTHNAGVQRANDLEAARHTLVQAKGAAADGEDGGYGTGCRSACLGASVP